MTDGDEVEKGGVIARGGCLLANGDGHVVKCYGAMVSGVDQTVTGG